MNSQTLVPVSSVRNSVKVTRPEVLTSINTKNKSLLKKLYKNSLLFNFHNIINERFLETFKKNHFLYPTFIYDKSSSKLIVMNSYYNFLDKK